MQGLKVKKLKDMYDKAIRGPKGDLNGSNAVKWLDQWRWLYKRSFRY